MAETAMEKAKAEALAIRVDGTDFTMAALADVFVASGFFRDLKAQSQAIVKILYGQELGLKPIQSMLSIHMVEGHPEVAAATLGALVKRSGRYDYRIKEHTPAVCEIEFFELSRDGKRESIGTSRFDGDDAKTAGLADRANHKHYPKNMKFARAMSNGVKWYCLDAVGSVPIYTEGEIAEERASLGLPAPEVIEAPNPYLPEQKAAPTQVDPVKHEGMHKRTPECEAMGCLDAEKVTRQKEAEAEPRAAEPTSKGSEAASQPAAPAAPQEREPVHEGPPSSGKPSNEGDDPSPAEAEEGPQTFTIGKIDYKTQGMTREQMLDSFRLVTIADKKIGKGYGVGLLKKMFSLSTRVDLTHAQAEKYLAALRQATAGEEKP